MWCRRWLEVLEVPAWQPGSKRYIAHPFHVAGVRSDKVAASDIAEHGLAIEPPCVTDFPLPNENVARGHAVSQQGVEQEE